MKRVINTFLVLAVTLVIVSCNDKRTPNLQFMPNMYEAVPYETYMSNPNYAPGMEERMPVAGTIARGAEFAFEYDNSIEGYELAKANLKSPLDSTMVDADRAKSLYTIYCASCHGTKGDGQGDLVKNEKFLGIPNYKDREITEGSIYHTIMYGKNMMGSHSSQLTEEERWQVTAYVQELRNN
ncbi:c-type cytochrome [Urechidicola vernalis]|uniref:Cytochrome c n=1 Tax=Urechidicola vernalis TaxID=3075600 RepID=A0ABU2Y4H2_9FLAO|nr:cytochrome c [Urechidicola sp. P050]MDT0552957.1 cytochrome c [Urechidicola sp. P050]